MLCQQDNQITIKTVSMDSKSSGNQRSLSRVLREVKCRQGEFVGRDRGSLAASSSFSTPLNHTTGGLGP